METKEAISILEKMFDSSDEMHESTDGDEYFWNQMQALDMGIKSLKEKSDDKRRSEMKILYLCDQERCEECHPDYCNHTTDIKHAKNFKEEVDRMYIEQETEDQDGNKRIISER